MTLDALIGKGLQREPTSANEIARFLAKIQTKLADAQSESISMETRFDIAYEALLQVGIVALRAHDLRTDSRGGHHTLALQTLVTTIGAPSAKIRLLDEFRRQRAASLYDGSFIPTQAELAELIGNVQQLYALLLTWLKANRPALLP